MLSIEAAMIERRRIQDGAIALDKGLAALLSAVRENGKAVSLANRRWYQVSKDE